MARVWIDADTGDEIIFFYRRGKPYFYLRDRYTKRFIRRLRRIEVRVFIVIEYSREKARKRNPIYVDLVTKTAVSEQYGEKVDEVREGLIDKGMDILARYFNPMLARQGYISGIEYGSIVETMAEYPRSYQYELVWKHYPLERGRYEWGIEPW